MRPERLPHGFNVVHRIAVVIRMGRQRHRIDCPGRSARDDAEGVTGGFRHDIGNGLEHPHLIGRAGAATGQHQGAVVVSGSRFDFAHTTDSPGPINTANTLTVAGTGTLSGLPY